MTSACTNRCSATDRLSAAKPIAACDDGPRDGWRLKVEDAAKGASSSGSILAVHSCQQGELRQVNFSGARLARLHLEEAVVADVDFLRRPPAGSQFIVRRSTWRDLAGHNFIANAPTPRPSRRIVGPNDRESNGVWVRAGDVETGHPDPAVSAPAPIPGLPDHGGAGRSRITSC